MARAVGVLEDETTNEVIIDGIVSSDDIFGPDETEGTLKVETRKLLLGEDPFLNVSWDALDKNTKRRIQRLEKANAPGMVANNSPSFSGGVSTMVNQSAIQTKYMVTKGGAKPKHLLPEQIYNAYFLWHLATPPYNLDYLSELTTANATHYACIKAKVTNIIGLGHNWQPTQKVKEAVQDVEDDENRSKKLFRKLARAMEGLDDSLEDLNANESFIDTLTKVWMDVEATGNGFLEVGRNRNGSIGYLGHIPAYSMRVRVDRDGYVQMLPSALNRLVYFRNFGDTKTKDLFNKDPQPNECIHFKKENMKNGYYGVPDIIAALPAIAGDKFAMEYNLEYFENKAVPRYALIIKGAKLSQQAERKILEYFRKEVKGKHHGTLYIPVPASAGSNVDVELKPIENTTQDFSFGDYRAFNRIEIMLAHRVPGSQIGVEAGKDQAASRESSKVFKEQVCRPEQNRIEWKINLIVKQLTDMFKFMFNELDLLDEETKSRIYDRYIRVGVYSPNDVLRKLGEQPREGGNQFLDPTMKPGGDANLGQGLEAATPGPPRITTDGSAKNARPGATPADQTSRGRASPFEVQDKGGPSFAR